MALVFVLSDGTMDVHDALRPAVQAQISHATASPCAARAAKQLEQAESRRVDAPPVDSSLVCELSDTALPTLEIRFCSHHVAAESRDGQTYNPCPPARAGPSLI